MGKIKDKLNKTRATAMIMAMLQLAGCGTSSQETDKDLDTKTKGKASTEWAMPDSKEDKHDHSHIHVEDVAPSEDLPEVSIEADKKGAKPAEDKGKTKDTIVNPTQGEDDKTPSSEIPSSKPTTDGSLETTEGTEEHVDHIFKKKPRILYVKGFNDTHYEIKVYECETCGKQIASTPVKKDCEFDIVSYDENFEYLSCPGCGRKKVVKHELGTGIVNRDGTITQSCKHEGCEYKYTYTPKKDESISRPGQGGGSHGGGGGGTEKPSHTHKWSEWVSINDKEEERRCACGETEKRDHKYENTVRYEKFTESMHKKITDQKCVNCGHSITSTVYETHDWDGGVLSEDGQWMIYTCKDCGEQKKVAITQEKHKHDYIQRRETRPNHDGTHTTYTIYTCTNKDGKCDHLSYEVKGATNDCSFDNGVKSEDGKWMIYTCKVCGDIKKVAITPEAHKHDYKETNSGLRDNGNGTHTPYTTYTCSNSDGNCDKVSYTKDGIPVSCTMTENIDSTVEFNDTQHYTVTTGNCACGHAMRNESNRESHDIIHGTKNFISNDENYCYSITDSCSGCKYTHTEKFGHVFTEVDRIENDDGTITIYSKCICGEEKEETITPEKHKHDYKETNSGLRDNGNGTHTPYTTYTCSNSDGKCDKVSYTKDGEPVSCTMTENVDSTVEFNDTQHYTVTTGNCACGHAMHNESNKESHNIIHGTRQDIGDENNCYSITDSCSGCGYTHTEYFGHSFTEVDRIENDDGTITIYSKCICGKEKEQTTGVPINTIPNVLPVVEGQPGAEEVPGNEKIDVPSTQVDPEKGTIPSEDGESAEPGQGPAAGEDGKGVEPGQGPAAGEDGEGVEPGQGPAAGEDGEGVEPGQGPAASEDGEGVEPGQGPVASEDGEGVESGKDVAAGEDGEGVESGKDAAASEDGEDAIQEKETIVGQDGEDQNLKNNEAEYLAEEVEKEAEPAAFEEIEVGGRTFVLQPRRNI